MKPRRRKVEKEIGDQNAAPPSRIGQDFFKRTLYALWLPTLLGIIAFLVFAPTLKSDLVNDGFLEVIQEGYVTHLSNLPAILSLHVLSTDVLSAQRPGLLLYLMIISSVWGTKAFGFHLGSNLLHAVNTALLFILIRRLLVLELPTKRLPLQLEVAAAVATLIFVVHPINVESVCEVSYAGGMLIAFFSFVTLLVATAFRPNRLGIVIAFGIFITICSFGSAVSKETGIATSLLLIVYWFLYRRSDPWLPWLSCLFFPIAVSVLFLGRFIYLGMPPEYHFPYVNGSFWGTFTIQPGIWVLMMEKLVWPVNLSGAYRILDLGAPPLWVAAPVLFTVWALQGWLAYRSRLGAMGAAMYWLGLLLVSNFFPINLPTADRYYYLPIAGIALQLTAFLVLIARHRVWFWGIVTACLLALVPMTALNLKRQHDAFSTDLAFFTDVCRVSPDYWWCRMERGFAFDRLGKFREAATEYQIALAHPSDPKKEPFASEVSQRTWPLIHYYRGADLERIGRLNEAILEYEEALKVKPDYPQALCGLAETLINVGKSPEAKKILDYMVQQYPGFSAPHYLLGTIELSSGAVNDAIGQFHQTQQLQPNFLPAYFDAGRALAAQGLYDQAMNEFSSITQIDPNNTDAYTATGDLWVLQAQFSQAVNAYGKALQLSPNSAVIHYKLGTILKKLAQNDEAANQLHIALSLDPDLADLTKKTPANEAINQFLNIVNPSPNTSDARGH